MIKSYPVRIEAFDEIDDLLFVVESVDEDLCAVTIKTVVSTSSWEDISNGIKLALEKISEGY